MHERVDNDFQEDGEVLEGWELVLRNPIPRGEIPLFYWLAMISNEEYASQPLRLFLLQESCYAVARYPHPDRTRNRGKGLDGAGWRTRIPAPPVVSLIRWIP